MKKPALKVLAAAVAISMAAFGANAADADVTGGVIYGSGNSNGGFTVNTSNSIEVGLRAHTRYPSPSDNAAGIGSNNNGTYNQAPGGFFNNGTAGGTLASWNFDWSINTNLGQPNGARPQPLSAYTYLMSLDFDPSAGVNSLTFDPLATYADHAFDNSFDASPPVTATPANFAALKTTSNLVQNSWNYDFFPISFDPAADGVYTISLAVLGAQGVVLSRTSIDVIVGAGASVPEPGSLALVGLALGGLAFARKRKTAK